MYRYKKFISIFISCLLFLMFIFTPIEVNGVEEEDYKILYINSYNEGYKWSDDIFTGIKSVFVEDQHNYLIEVEYMDMQHISDDLYFQKLFEIFSYKYSSNDFDLIITSDEAAYEFINEYGLQLFGQTPIVFCGVNHYDENKKLSHMTGIVEGYEIEATIDLALDLHPSTKNIYYINGHSLTELAIEKDLNLSFLKYKDRINFVKLENDNLNDMTFEINSLQEDSLVLYLLYVQTENGDSYEYNEAIKYISERTTVPIYGCWNFLLGEGIIGGKLTSGFVQGEMAAKVGLDILNGEDISDMNVLVNDFTEYKFDYEKLIEHNIDISLLPKNSHIINYSNDNNKQVLILNSYNKGLQWTDDIESGIKSVLGETDFEIEYSFEYMDIKKHNEAEYKQSLYEFLNTKYKYDQFDLIVTTDDAAFQFIQKYYTSLFEDTPVFFTGVNHFDKDSMTNAFAYTGVIESYDLQGTIDLALEVLPDTKKMIFINDTTLTGQNNRINIDRVLEKSDYSLDVEFWEDMNMSDILVKGANLEEDTIVILLTFNKDKSNNSYTYDESIDLISDKISVPIFSVWDFYLDKGIVGGKLIIGYQQGEIIGEMISLYLSGEHIDNIPILYDVPYDIMFDFTQVAKADINVKQLPVDSTIINSPFSIKDFYQDNSNFINITLVVLLLILIGALIIVVTLLKKNLEFRINAEETERLYATTDELTGVFNRRMGLKLLQDEIDKENDNLSICYIDVNDLKKVNDSFGHGAGDDLIKSLTQVIQKNIKQEDILCRLGGDEFMIILPNKSNYKTMIIMDLVNDILSDKARLENSEYTISFSQGIVEYNPIKHKTIESFIEDADEEMYKDKQQKKAN